MKTDSQFFGRKKTPTLPPNTPQMPNLAFLHDLTFLGIACREVVQILNRDRGYLGVQYIYYTNSIQISRSGSRAFLEIFDPFLVVS